MNTTNKSPHSSPTATTTKSPSILLISLSIAGCIVIICVLIIVIGCLIWYIKKKSKKESESKIKESKVAAAASKNKSTMKKKASSEASKSLTKITQTEMHQTEDQTAHPPPPSKQQPPSSSTLENNYIPNPTTTTEIERVPRVIESKMDMEKIRTAAEFFLECEQRNLREKYNDEKFVISNDECPEYIKDITKLYPEKPKISPNDDEVEIFLARINMCIEKSEVLRENAIKEFTSRGCNFSSKKSPQFSSKARKWYQNSKTPGYYQYWAFIHEYPTLFSYTLNSAEMNDFFDAIPIPLLYCYFINEKIPIWIRIFAMEKLRKAATPFLKKSDPAMLSILPHPMPVLSSAYQKTPSILEDPYWQSLDGNVRSFIETKKEQMM